MPAEPVPPGAQRLPAPGRKPWKTHPMTEHAEHSAPRPRRRPFRAIQRFLDSIAPLLDFLGLLAGLVLVINLMIRSLNGEHFGMF